MPTNEEIDELVKQSVIAATVAVGDIVKDQPDAVQATVIGESIIVMTAGYLQQLSEDAPLAAAKFREILGKVSNAPA